MSKSDPDSAIFMEDTVEDVKRKIKKAYCPPEVVEKNPIIDYAKHLILGYFGKIVINIESVSVLLLLLMNRLHLTLRSCFVQVPVEYTEYAALEADYLSGRIHPGDLKASVTEALNRILEPVRQHFASGEPKALLEKIKKFKVTRQKLKFI